MWKMFHLPTLVELFISSGNFLYYFASFLAKLEEQAELFSMEGKNIVQLTKKIWSN